MIYEKSRPEYPRLAGETDDSPRLRRAVADCANGILYIPRGVYLLASPIVVDNFASLYMHPAAILRAAAEMDFVVTWDGGAQYENLIVRTPDGEIFDNLNMFIRGGDIDGAGLASCLCVRHYHHFTLSDIALHNGKKYGLYTGGGHGYELIANNVYAKCTLSGLAGNCGICSRLSDSHYTDCIIVDYTVGMEIAGSSNRLTRCHVWGGIVKPLHGYTQDEWCALYNKRKFGAPDAGSPDSWFSDNLPEMLYDSVCFKISGCSNNLEVCYADTGMTGYLMSGSDNYLNCCQSYNNTRFGMDGDTIIRHTGGALHLSGCVFRKCAPNTKLYEGSGKGLYILDTATAGTDDFRFPNSTADSSGRLNPYAG